MRRLVLLLTCAAFFATAASATGAPALRAVGTQPLTVHGVRFRPHERVTVRLTVAGSVRLRVVRTTAAGTFTTTFAEVALERCTRYMVIARGSRGSSATLRPMPFFRDCSPL